jgi:hypothetical protein
VNQVTKEQKRQIRLRISELIEQNREQHSFENEKEIVRLGQLLGVAEKRPKRKNHQWSGIEIYYLMNHVPVIGFERTAENLNRTLKATKGMYYKEINKKQKNFSPGTGREVS